MIKTPTLELSCSDTQADALRNYVADHLVWELLDENKYEFFGGRHTNLMTLRKKSGREISEREIFTLGFYAARSI